MPAMYEIREAAYQPVRYFDAIESLHEATKEAYAQYSHFMLICATLEQSCRECITVLGNFRGNPEYPEDTETYELLKSYATLLLHAGRSKTKSWKIYRDFSSKLEAQ